MKPDIDQLIEYYELEKANLESLIQSCLQEWDYQGAHYHAVALRKINFKLQTLGNLKDPFYEDKSRLETMKSYLEKLASDEQFKGNEEFYKSEIEKTQKKITSLKEKKSIEKPDRQEFDDTIYDLIERKIKAFKFHLKKEEKLYLQFSLKEGDLLILSFTPLDQLGEFSILRSNLKELKLIGFELNPDTNSFEYIYNIATFANSIFLKQLVSRILFDALFYKELDDPASIEIE